MRLASSCTIDKSDSMPGAGRRTGCHFLKPPSGCPPLLISRRLTVSQNCSLLTPIAGQGPTGSGDLLRKPRQDVSSQI